MFSTLLVSTIFVVINAYDHCSGQSGLKCEQVAPHLKEFFDCPAFSIGPLEKECISNDGKCVEENDECICKVEEDTACECIGADGDKSCSDNNCHEAHDHNPEWQCAANTNGQCRCREQCQLPKTKLGKWIYCEQDDCDSFNTSKCTSCQLYSNKKVSGRIDSSTCKKINHCQWPDRSWKGQLCVEPPCDPEIGYKYCPRNKCNDCRPKWDDTYPKCRVVEGDTDPKCDNNCEYENFPCTYKECKPQFGWEPCELDNKPGVGECNGCKSCDDYITDCEDKDKCRMNDGGRCVKKKIAFETYHQIKGNASDIWQYIVNDYTTQEEEDLIKPECKCTPQCHNKVMKNPGDWEENVATPTNPDNRGKWINTLQKAWICSICATKTTVYSKLICVADEVKNALSNPDCVCRHHARVLWMILTDCFSDDITSVDIVRGTIKGDIIGHALVNVIFTDEDSNTCDLYIDSYNDAYLLIGDCNQTDTPASTAVPNSVTRWLRTGFPLCSVADGCDKKECNTFQFVGRALPAHDAAIHCKQTYNSTLGTIKNQYDMLKAYWFMKGVESIWIGLKNIHIAGWFIHSDGTPCKHFETGACVDGCMWKDGHPQKTCEQHKGSWSVALYLDGYIDNTEAEDVEKPFLCNCAEDDL